MKDKFSKFSLPLLFIFSFIIIIFMITQTVHAESYFPMSQNANEHFTDYDISTIETIYDSENYNVFAYYAGYAPGYGTRMKNFYIVRFPKNQETEANVFGEINSNGYSFSLYGWSNPVLTYGFLQILEQNWEYQYYASMSNFQNIPSNIYNTDIDYVSNFRVYTTNNKDVTVLSYGSENPIVDIGTAIIPAPFIEPLYPTGETPPSTVPPSYTINNYTWTTNNPPSFDSSSVEAGLESLGDIISYQIGWLSDNLHGEFTTLAANIKGLVDYIGKTLQYYGNAIISTINNGIQNFYDNMANLVQPIFDKIAYITEPIDTADISSTFYGTNFYGVKSQFTSAFTSFENAFDISEPDTFTLTINIQNIRTFYNFGCHYPVIIHLDEHFTPIKAALRIFLWILISFGTVFVVEKGLSNWLRGERTS